MKIEIFDVEHGQCTAITCPNGELIIIDAGHNSSSGWRPSKHYAGRTIDLMVISNFDEDHTSDFDGLKSQIKQIKLNHSVTSGILQYIKNDGMGKGINALHGLMKGNEASNNFAPPIPIKDVTVTHYYNSYPDFDDANNLSVVTFIKYRNFSIVFPGDVEKEGWRRLLEQPGFADELKGVTVMVASHHGRENGCCEEVFLHCSPMAVVISDKGIEHATQETVGWYANRTFGCITSERKARKVFTTRSDGKITIEVGETQWGITPQPASTTIEALARAIMAQYP